MTEIGNLVFQHGAVLIAMISAVAAIYALIRRLEMCATLFAAARVATKEFYAHVDELFKEPDLPDDLKTVLYDLLLVVTNEDLGRQVFKILAVAERAEKNSDSNGLGAVLIELSKRRPDVASRFADAVRMGFNAVLCSYGHSSQAVAVTIVRTSEQSRLLSAIENIESRLSSVARDHPMPQPA